MKNTKTQAVKFFSTYFNCSIDEAKTLNHLTIDCMVKYANQFINQENE